MTLVKVVYDDDEGTVIHDDNLNAIQDEVIANGTAISGKEAKGKCTISGTEYSIVVTSSGSGTANTITFITE